MAEIKNLQRAWTELYSKSLPSLARAHDRAQPKWPVTLDHCFARIILDNTIGEGREPWDQRVKRPAIRNMSCQQLNQAIALGERIKDGKEDLVALDLRSLEARGKTHKKYKKGLPAAEAADLEKDDSEVARDVLSPVRVSKRKMVPQNDVGASAHSIKRAKISSKQSTLDFLQRPSQAENLPSPSATEDGETDLSPALNKLKSHPALTPYRKRLYAALLSVPRGRYTTYAALSNFLVSSARAVGNGMRNNPFAPEVPCHRVLASDGSIGGFGGSWGADGKNAGKKFELLQKEGVKFDSKGKVRGPPFENFVGLLECG